MQIQTTVSNQLTEVRMAIINRSISNECWRGLKCKLLPPLCRTAWGFIFFKARNKITMCMYSVTQLWLTLCDPLDCSPLGSSVHEIFSGKNTGAGCHFLLQGDFSNPGIEPMSPASPVLQADSLPLSHQGSLIHHMTQQPHYWAYSIRKP